MKTLFILLFIISSAAGNCQSLYINTFGDKESKPIIFLHGGPGYNSANFEATIAQKLSEKGFFVIVYDRRGEGRSIDANAKFTFEETFNDINSIYDSYGLTSASFIAHSFGGIVGTLYAQKYSDKVNALFLTSAPVSLQESFKYILTTCEQIYTDKNDSLNLQTIRLIEKMDTSSIQYSSSCFMQAMKNNFYSPKSRTEESKVIFNNLKSDSLYKYAGAMTIQAPLGFWKNENYTTIDLTNSIKDLITKKVEVVGLYGKDDGLYSAEQVSELQKLLGTDNLIYFENCSHSVYIDRQSEFIDAVSERIK